MLVNLLHRESFFIKISIVLLFTSLGLITIQVSAYTQHNLLSLCLISLIYIFVGYVDQKHDFISSSSFAAFFYSICLMPFFGGLLDYKIAGSLLLFTCTIIELIYFEKEKKEKENAFDIGIFISLAIILSPTLIFLSVIILGYFFALKEISPKIFSLSLLGFLFPILIVFQICILLDYGELIDYYKETLQFNFVRLETKQILLIPLCFIIFLAFINDIRKSIKIRPQLKRTLFLVYITFIVLIITYILYGGKSDFYLAFTAFSIMVILTNYFQHMHSSYDRIKEGLLWIILISLLCYHFYDYIIAFINLILRITS